MRIRITTLTNDIVLGAFPGAEGALQAGAEEGGEAGAAHQVPEGAGQALPGLPHQRSQEGVQGVPQDHLHSGTSKALDF